MLMNVVTNKRLFRCCGQRPGMTPFPLNGERAGVRGEKSEGRCNTLCSPRYRAVLACFAFLALPVVADEPVTSSPRSITVLDPPEKGVFSKRLDFHAIPIKAHKVVVDEALFAACGRLSMMFSNLLIKQPMVISNLVCRLLL